ncbi:RcnB family protein [Sphingomonas sp.]|uniref:RcnB family protein n=1 Tax=Sphingomonas sp. TaxID=28214 RepID=UPI002BC6FBD0|nr:RcnB family protein [Sphingomonas sp.]HWK36849.1 RcnB family protein [Sphingomonas sp.]
MKRLLLVTTSVLLVLPDIAMAQATTRPAQGQAKPVRPGGPQVHPNRPGQGGPQVQPPRPGGPQVQRPQPQPPRPPAVVRPPRPQPPHRPGAGRPPSFRPIHGPQFRYPRGYRYRRWTVGLLLPALFLSNSYYYNNYAAMGIGAPPPGYRWVRYGPDLLLVQTRTRRVVDVIYGAFY